MDDSAKIKWLERTLIFIRGEAMGLLESGGVTFRYGKRYENFNGKLDMEQIQGLYEIMEACNQHLHG